MKKIILIAAVMAVAMSASAQWFNFSNNKERLDIGAHFGEGGRGCNYTALGGGVSLAVYGVYIDFFNSSPQHKYDNHVLPQLYNDTSILAINLGYQIPVLPWLRVMPLIGHCHTSAGITDASTVNIDVDGEYNARIYHDFNVTRRWHYLNFGGGIFVQPIEWLNIYAVYTSTAVYGGLSLSLGKYIKELSYYEK